MPALSNYAIVHDREDQQAGQEPAIHGQELRCLHFQIPAIILIAEATSGHPCPLCSRRAPHCGWTLSLPLSAITTPLLTCTRVPGSWSRRTWRCSPWYSYVTS